jgi:hypothetical protein
MGLLLCDKAAAGRVWCRSHGVTIALHLGLVDHGCIIAVRRGGCGPSLAKRLAGGGELKVTESNNGMQRSADTTALIFQQRPCAPADAGRSAAVEW